MLVAPLPAPSAVIPPTPAALVASLARDEHRLAEAIDRWDKRSPAPRDVTLLALYEQRVISFVARRPELAGRVERLRPAVSDDVAARVDLDRLVSAAPPLRARPRLGRPPAPARLLGWYREAQRRFGIRWQILAAIHFVESAFGKVRNASGAGAQGPMQFEPATWRAYGLGGDVNNPHDAILGAANYLAANDGERNERRALFHYNHSQLYVDAVARYARRITRDRRAFFDYYSWQVYFRTPTGYRRVTGPR